jgi:D-xylose reductase
MQTPLHKTWKEMENCVKLGLTKSIGVSNFNVQLLLDLLSYAEIAPVVNQVEMHPYLPQNDLLYFCKEMNIVIEAYSPLTAPGLIDTLRNTEKIRKNIFEEEIIKKRCEKYEKSGGQIILNWGLSRDVVILPKTEKKERMIENLKSMSFVMDGEDVKLIDSLECGERSLESKHLPEVFGGFNMFA